MASEATVELEEEVLPTPVADEDDGVYTPRDLYADAINYLIHLFRQPRWLDLLNANIVAWQEIEDRINYILDNYNEDDATEYLLDLVGAAVNEPRLGRSDTLYRLAIKVRLMIERSSGTHPQLVAIMDTAAPSATNKLEQVAPKAILATVTGGVLSAAVKIALANYLEQARAAGEGLDVVFGTGDTWQSTDLSEGTAVWASVFLEEGAFTWAETIDAVTEAPLIPPGVAPPGGLGTFTIPFAAGAAGQAGP